MDPSRMVGPNDIYRPSLSLLTDLYELTMAYGYWKVGRLEDQAAFNLFFRRNPFGSGYTVACGLAHAIDYLTNLRFREGDLEYLRGLEGNDGSPLFDPGYLDYLADLRFEVDVDAVPEGTVVFAHEPLVRVKGPILQAQLLETALLTIVNFQTLIATKAARIRTAAQDDVVLEFGLRRAQGIDGGIAASRAAYVGGCDGSSNVLAGKLFGTPVKGTHAHSWVMLFDDEREAFEAYARAMPNNCVFLVDTYDTREGVCRAIATGLGLREKGYAMVGIRLDSGDLAYLSIEARRMLDEAGFPDAKIVASSDLDEHLVASLKAQGAKIDIWGIGTKLVTAHDDPALGGVYKLAAVKRPGESWKPRVKVSDQAVKVSTPGVLQTRRYRLNDHFIADAIYDESFGVDGPPVVIDPGDPTRRKSIPTEADHEDLLVPVFRNGKAVYQSPSLDEIRSRVRAQLDSLHPGIKRFTNPHAYPAGLEQGIYDRKMKLLLQARGMEA